MKKVGRQRVAVPEEERRAKDIAAVHHPEIRQIVTRCIVDDDAARATAAAIVKICHLLLLLHPTVPVPRPEAAEEATQDPEPVSLTQVFVKGLTGKTIMVEAQPTDTVRALKGKIAEVDGMPPVEKQRLVLGGRQLEDRFTLVDYNIEHESVLHMALRQTAEAVEPEPASEPEPQSELGEKELARREARKQAKKQRRAEEKAARAREAAAIAAAQAEAEQAAQRARKEAKRVAKEEAMAAAAERESAEAEAEAARQRAERERLERAAALAAAAEAER